MDNSSLSRGRLRISLKQNLAYIKFLTCPTSPYSFKKGIPASYFEVFLAIWRRDPQGNCNKILKNDNYMLIFYLQCISQALHRIALKKLLYGKYWATDKRLYVKKRNPASYDAGFHFKITQKEVKYWSSKNGTWNHFDAVLGSESFHIKFFFDQVIFDVFRFSSQISIKEAIAF